MPAECTAPRAPPRPATCRVRASAASSWIDSTGNLWLFGGYGLGSTGVRATSTICGEYSPSSGQWTWVSGGTASMPVGSTAPRARASASNVPGARYSAPAPGSTPTATCGCSAGTATTAGAAGKLNDLWRVQSSAGVDLGQWRQAAVNGSGVYGTQGTAAAGNVPGARTRPNRLDRFGWQHLAVRRELATTRPAIGRPQRSVAIQPEQRAVDLDQWRRAAPMPSVSTARRARPRPATCRARAHAASSWIDSVRQPVVVRRGMAMTRPGSGGEPQRSVANTVRAAGSGPGSVAEAAPMPLGSMARWAPPRPATCRERARAASSWIDSSGNLWLFGGVGYDASGGVG